MPTRSDQNKAGPGEVKETAIKITAIIGANISNKAKETRISMPRFTLE